MSSNGESMILLLLPLKHPDKSLYLSMVMEELAKPFFGKLLLAAYAESEIVLAVTSSGIASLLLPAGWTTHSRFKLPLELTEESLCKIRKNTHIGKLLA